MNELMDRLQERAEVVRQERIVERAAAAEALAQAQAAKRERQQEIRRAYGERYERFMIMAQLIAEAATEKGVEPDIEIVDKLFDTVVQGWKVRATPHPTSKLVPGRFGWGERTEPATATNGTILTTSGALFFFNDAEGRPEDVRQVKDGHLDGFGHYMSEEPPDAAYSIDQIEEVGRLIWLEPTLAAFAENHDLEI